MNLIREVNLLKYIHLNYFSKNVLRKGKGKLVPYKNAIIDLSTNSKIIIYDENLEIGTGKLKKSKIETLLRLRNNAEWECEKGGQVAYGSTIEILDHGFLKTKFFTMNSFSTLVCKNNISIGDNVMIARNVTIYDSDFHLIKDRNNNVINNSAEKVIIGNNVWIGASSMILKNVSINDDSVIAACSLITKDIHSNSLVCSQNILKVLKNDINWIR